MLDATWIYDETYHDLKEGVRYIWHEGGARASKTYNIAIALIHWIAQTGKTLDVVRLSNPALKGSVYIDLIEIATAMGLYSEARHNKTDQYMLVGKGRIRYYGVDDEQKVRGWKRDLLWMNEANEISSDKRRQLWMRTNESIVLDHNPTVDDDHWIVKLLESRVASGECRHYHSTYKDNPFLPGALVREIEAMQHDDPYGWQVYGLGLRGTNPAAVFDDVQLGTFDPQSDTVYGTDFGFKDPFVVCEWGWRDSNPPDVPRATLYCRPLVYGTHMTTGDAIEALNEMKADKTKTMWCDSAEPDRILELRQAGYNAKPVHKAPGVREASYDWMKRHRFVVDAKADTAEAVKSELRRTRHKKKPGTDIYTDKVVDADDHVADTGRYGAFSRWGRMPEKRYSRRRAMAGV